MTNEFVRYLFDSRNVSANVFDPMTGSGTRCDVCRELEIPCTSLDIRGGFDATNPASYRALKGKSFDLVWAHPPYWRQKLYTEQPGDLSRTATLDAFLAGYQAFIESCASLLSHKGRFAILMGDYFDREVGFVPLTYHTKRHGASSSRKTYRSSFIPGLHDVCMIFER